MRTPNSDNKVEIVLQLQALHEELSNAENEYHFLLRQDKEFEILKELKLRIRELRGKISLYSEIVNNEQHIN
jgi:hypothetical protein